MSLHFYIFCTTKNKMCGIFVYLKKLGYVSKISKGQLYDAFMKMKSRGPDRSSFVELSDYGVCLGFHRLAIMDTSCKGDQPFTYEDEEKQIYLLCNGEIYNFDSLAKKYNIELKSGSDCEVLLPLYLKIGLDEMIKELLGEFSFCICEVWKKSKEIKLYTGRDQAGTRMLYITGDSNEVVICSELKSSPFLQDGYEVRQFQPRHYLEISNSDEKLFNLQSTKLTKWLDFRNIQITIKDVETAKLLIRTKLVNAVKTMTMGHRKFCCLLSGGLDSSLVASILAEFCKENDITLYTFSIGLDTGSTDRPFAEMVAKHIGSVHQHIEVSEEYALKTLSKIPGLIETIDITTPRASDFQFMLLDWIAKNTDFKVVFCGDGSDELFTSYKYFLNAPSAVDLHYEGIRLIEDIHMYDGLRAGMSATACGLEIRFAFLHKELIETVLAIDPELRMAKNGVEKWILRSAFADTTYLPSEVIWRSKEAMSDGISELSRSWFEIVRDHISTMYTDEELEIAKLKYTHVPIISKESLFYRHMFEEAFGTSENNQMVIPYYWMPKWTKQIHGTVPDPSARVLEVYK